MGPGVGPGEGPGVGPGVGPGGDGGFHGAITMEVKLENFAGHLVVGQLGPVSVEQFTQRCAKSHSLYHPQLASKGLPRVTPQLTYWAIVQFSALIAATQSSNVR